MISREQSAEIRRLYFGEHWKKGTIAAQLGVHADTVEHAIGATGPEPQAGPRPSVLDPYKAFVSDTLHRYPRLRSTRLFDMLCQRGFVGSERTLRRYVEEVRPTPRKEVFLRVERLPGEQAQVDWGHVGKLRVAGGERALWVFVIVLAHSRALWAELVLDLGVHSLCRSLVRASNYFGGITRQWLFDNPKTVVLERQGDVVRFQPTLLELCAQLHVQPRLCGVRKPQEKGGVERAIRYLKERFFAARSIHSIEQANAELLAFADGTARERAHPVFPQLSVRQVFEQEQPRLLSLPSVMPCTDNILPARADKTASVRFDTNRYSVPLEHAYKTLTLVANDVTVRMLDRDREVASHVRAWGRSQLIEVPEHRRALIRRKRAGRETKGKDRLLTQLERVGELLQHWAEEGRNMGSMTSRLLKMLDVYGQRALNESLQELRERGGYDLGALTVLCEKRRVPKPIALPLQLAPHVNDRDVIPHDIGGYDD